MEHTEWRILRFVSMATGLKCRKQCPLLQPNQDMISSKLGFSNMHMLWNSVPLKLTHPPVPNYKPSRY